MTLSVTIAKLFEDFKSNQRLGDNLNPIKGLMGYLKNSKNSKVV